MPENDKRIVSLIILSFFLGLVGWAKIPEVTEIGNKVSFKSSKFHAVMEKGKEFSDSYVVFGKSKSADTFFDELMLLMPLSKATELSKRYGDFTQCSNAGSLQGKEATKNYWVIADNMEVRNKIDKKAKSIISIGNRSYPVIKLKGIELQLQILAMIINGKEVAVDDSQTPKSGIFIFVKDVEIADY